MLSSSDDQPANPVEAPVTSSMVTNGEDANGSTNHSDDVMAVSQCKLYPPDLSPVTTNADTASGGQKRGADDEGDGSMNDSPDSKRRR